MRARVLHVDTARSWRGGQNQVLLTAQGMSARGVPTEVVCRRGGELESRAVASNPHEADLALLYDDLRVARC